ncbi:MAG: FkbM family methyltransferase [Candidatus Korarchaeum sp.]
MTHEIPTRLRVLMNNVLTARSKEAVVGSVRYFLYDPIPHNLKDYSILQTLMRMCGLPLERHTLNRLLDRNPTVIQFNDGTRFAAIELEDFLHASLCYEPKTLAFISRRLAEGGIFVDVGANVGGYAIRAAKSAHVYAFEPHPRNFYLLELNAKLNRRLDNIRAFQVAVGSYSGKAKLAVSDHHGWHSLLHSSVKNIKKVTRLLR